MYSPFEPTKIVFLSFLDNCSFDIITTVIYILKNNFMLLIIFFFFFLFILFFFFSFNFESPIIYFIYLIYDFVFDLIESYLGEGDDSLDDDLIEEIFPFLLFLFFFLWLNNIIGLLPFQFAVTSHLTTTFSFSLFIWFLVVVLGFYLNGFSFFLLILPTGIPYLLIPFLICIEFISYIFRSLSLAIRLFANIFAGHILLHVVSSSISFLLINSISGFLFTEFFKGLISIIILFVLFIFEFLVACLQSYIFLVLSLIYLRDLNNLSH